MIALNALTAVTAFDLVYLMTLGGPGVATMLLSILSFRTFFLDLEIGQGAASAVLMTVVALIIGVIYLTILYRRMSVYR